MGFEKNYLTISLPNVSQIGSGPVDLDLEMYAQLLEILILRKIQNSF